MARVIHALNDDLTPFDLRAQILRVNVELSVHYRGQKIFSKKYLKVTFRLEKLISWIPRNFKIVIFKPELSFSREKS